ncbi:hypothetical protein O7626_13420 [Micromonospora sp. WMMD1102]|uniref:hypothetical protein n=1 Tax=Micromonospora sp. WMMD1102 TaxID=3016105 RepID=UPI002414E388|nr:hypothetical protein [Micromonospora sp. WMMD1102]MDG4786918.1 hypothetical protein [Micromonospora sp. WMMD1102]
MGRAEVDRVLDALGAAHNRASAAMYALDSRPESALLRATRLTGETARFAAVTHARTGALWSQFAAFGALLGQAREVRARRARPGDTELAELAHLLGAPVVALDADGVVALDADGSVLDDPAVGGSALELPGVGGSVLDGRAVRGSMPGGSAGGGSVPGSLAAVPAERIGLTELARRIEAEANALAGTLGELEAARARLAGQFGRLTEALRRLRTDGLDGVEGLDGSDGFDGSDRLDRSDGLDPPGEPDRLGRLAGAVEEAYTDALADPLGAAGNGPVATAVRDRLRRFEAEVAALTSELAELVALRTGYPGRTARLAADLDELAAAAAETSRVHGLAQVKIANSGLPELPPNPTPALRAQLAQLGQLHREHRWSQVGTELAALERGVVSARQRLAESHEAADGLLRRRAELRGRLDAYRAKAGRLGLIEHTELSARHRLARDLLYTSPCDLPAATRAVVAYQRHLNDLTGRPAPGAKGAPA